MAPYDEGGGSFLPPSSEPRRVRGGIRMQSRRGGTSWWSRRWLAALEAGAVGERLKQGIDDARRGQVLELEPGLGELHARVQGARSEPHAVALRMTPVEQATWLRVARSINQRGASRAALLRGELPEDVEAAFRREGVELFPSFDDDLDVSCTCEDWSTPCRHALASCLLLSELLDADPTLALRLRGIEPDLLRTLVSAAPEPVSRDAAVDGVDVAPDTQAMTADDVARFWLGAEVAVALDVEAPSIDAPLVRVLGSPPLWRGADAFEPAMRRLYARVSSDPRTVDLALSAPEDA